MKAPRLCWLVSANLAAAILVQAQLVVYSFGSAASPSTMATSVAAGITASAFSGSLGTPAAGGTSPLYTAGSGGGYFNASSWTGTAPGTNYFEFTLTPDSGQALAITSLSFGYRATATGPTAFAVRSGADAFASTLAAGTITGDSAWHSSGSLSMTLSGLSAPITLRIYGSGASSSLGTLRIDDVTLSGSVTAVPEPATYASILGIAALVGAAIRRRRMQHTG